MTLPGGIHITRSVILDILVVALAGLTVLFVELYSVPFSRGYSCSDYSIRLPYFKDTISILAVGLGFVVGGGILIALVEILLAPNSCAPSSVRWRSRALPVWAVQVYRSELTFFLGAAISQILTDIAKYHVGALRPHFLAVCQSDVSCATQSDPFASIDSYTCRGDPAKVSNARLSFPSGHASMSFYCAVFIVLHLQKRLETENDLSGPPRFLACFFLRPLIQGMAVMAAWFTSVTRVMDNQHHYRDIFVGAILGTVVALSIIRGIRPFRPAFFLDPHEETPLRQVQTSGGAQLNHHDSNNHSTSPISPRSDP